MGAFMRMTIAAALAFGLAGCAATNGPGMKTVIGLNKADLLSCAGVPARIIGVGNEERLVYLREPDRWRATTGGLVIGGDSGGAGFGFGLLAPLGTVGRGCAATVSVIDGRVAGVSLSPDSAPEMCAPLFANCRAH